MLSAMLRSIGIAALTLLASAAACPRSGTAPPEAVGPSCRPEPPPEIGRERARLEERVKAAGLKADVRKADPARFDAALAADPCVAQWLRWFLPPHELALEAIGSRLPPDQAEALAQQAAVSFWKDQVGGEERLSQLHQILTAARPAGRAQALVQALRDRASSPPFDDVLRKLRP